MLRLSAACRYYVCCAATDMRKGFDSLSGLVAAHMKEDALSKAVFIFFNKKHNQVKVLLWEGDGFALYYKRLEKGTHELPVCTQHTTVLSITNEQLQLILQGISLRSVKHRKRYQHTAQSSGQPIS